MPDYIFLKSFGLNTFKKIASLFLLSLASPPGMERTASTSGRARKSRNKRNAAARREQGQKRPRSPDVRMADLSEERRRHYLDGQSPEANHQATCGGKDVTGATALSASFPNQNAANFGSSTEFEMNTVLHTSAKRKKKSFLCLTGVITQLDLSGILGDW